VPDEVLASLSRTSDLVDDPQQVLALAHQAIRVGDRAHLDPAIEALYHTHALAGRNPQVADALGLVLAESLLARDAPGDLQRAISRLRWLDGPRARDLLQVAESRQS
jgi:hypothetical protein